ncbi:MAG: hypothetical protein KDB03_12275 [Planctomycetales bacterium]|nr:hypothetical protein [Planctomycetales bacterium]
MTIFKPNSDPPSVQLATDNLGLLNFSWQQDRYCHRWAFANSPDLFTLESVESDAGECWPTSPPLQQLHQQSFPDGREVVFGVGMSGRGHWSASFTMVPDLNAWIIELACRSPQPPIHLGSRYRCSGGLSAQTNGKAVQLSSEVGTIACMEPIDPGCTLAFTDDFMDLLPTTSLDKQLGATIQWAFRIRIV